MMSLSCRMCCLCHLYIILIPVTHVLCVSYLTDLCPCAAACVVSSLYRCLSCSVFHRREIIAVGFRPVCNRPRDSYLPSSVPLLSPVLSMSFVYTRHPCIACDVSSQYRCHVQSFTDGRSLQWVFGLHATALVIHTY